MSKSMGFLVPSNSVRLGQDHTVRTLVAGAALSPTNGVAFGAGAERVVVNPIAGKLCIGVADRNYQAIADDEDPMTHAFAAGEKVAVILEGLVVVVAGAAGMTMGTLAMSGAAAAGVFQDSALAVVEPSVVGRALTTAAAAAKAVMKLF
jgi:hypothetical protein